MENQIESDILDISLLANLLKQSNVGENIMDSVNTMKSNIIKNGKQ